MIVSNEHNLIDSENIKDWTDGLITGDEKFIATRHS